MLIYAYITGLWNKFTLNFAINIEKYFNGRPATCQSNLLRATCSQLQSNLLRAHEYCNIASQYCNLARNRTPDFTVMVENQEQCCPNNIVVSCFQQPVTAHNFLPCRQKIHTAARKIIKISTAWSWNAATVRNLRCSLWRFYYKERTYNLFLVPENSIEQCCAAHIVHSCSACSIFIPIEINKCVSGNVGNYFRKCDISIVRHGINSANNFRVFSSEMMRQFE